MKVGKRMMSGSGIGTGAVLAAAVLLLAAPGSAGAATDAERLAELERKVEVLTREVERKRFGDIYAEPGESVYGMGPAASKVYAKTGGLSIGGYGEALYQRFDGDKPDQADMLRAILYVGYKFDNKWVLNTEFELEHADEAFVEFAYLDYLHSEALNVRAGLVLVPMGLVNELHEPTVFLSARRPDVENRIIPTTWRENGVGLFGELGDFSYKAYVLNGLNGGGFSASGLRGGRQKGSQALAEDLAGVVRVDWSPAPGVLAGVSAYAGDSGQDLGPAVSTEILEAHADFRRHGLQVRALAAVANVDDVAALNRALAVPAAEGEPAPADAAIDSIGDRLEGWYVEAGYDLLNARGGEASVTPFVRYEVYDTQSSIPAGFMRSGGNDVEVVTVGVNVKPIDEIVFKADYQFYDNQADSANDQFNLAMGYVF